MKNITQIFIVCAAMLFGPLLPASAQTQGNQGHHQSGVIGRVQVEQIALPPLWKVHVSTQTFQLIEDVQTDEGGRFIVNLKPGTYYLTPFLGGDGGGSLVGPPMLVTVEKKDFTIVELPIFFGPS